MKITFVTDSYIPNTGRFMNVVPEELQKRGHKVILYTSSDQYEPDIDVPLPKYVVKIKGKIIFGKNFYPGLIKKLLFDEKPDIVHSYVMGFFSTFVSGYLKKIKGYNLVIEPDISVDAPRISMLKMPYFLLYRKLPTTFADILIVYTKEQKKELIQKYGFEEKKIEILPWGVNIRSFSSKPKRNFRRYLNLKNKIIILNVGRVIPVRDFETIIKVLALIKNRNFVFVHIGSFPEKAYKLKLLKLIKRNRIEDKIIFMGQRSWRDVLNFYKTADVYLQISKSESFCKPLLEAMASGLPVISTNVGIAREIVKNYKTGFIVESERDVLDKVNLLIENETLRKKMSKNCKKISKQFDWKNVIDRLEKIYKKLI